MIINHNDSKKTQLWLNDIHLSEWVLDFVLVCRFEPVAHHTGDGFQGLDLFWKTYKYCQGCSNESINAGNWCMVYWRTTFCLMINWSMRARYSNPGGQSTGTMFWETWRGTGWGHLQVENQGSKNMVSWKKDKLFKSLHLSHPCPIFSLHWSTNRSSLKEKLVIFPERTMILVLFEVVSPVI